MNILVLSEAYPSNENIYPNSFVHSRCSVYIKFNINVDVISFSAENSYMFEGINVYTEKEYLKLKKNFDVIISHAPSLNNHLRLLLKRGYRDRSLIVFFHGHEVMNTNKHYPKAFDYDLKNKVKKIIKFIYDPIKLFLLKKFIKYRIKRNDIFLVFVSNWMKETAFDSMGLTLEEISLFSKYSNIIFNGVNSNFLDERHSLENNKLADFITIRPFDNPKYGIDIVYRIARDNPNYLFHIYGRGKFFNNKKELPNLKIFNRFILQKDIPCLLNKYQAALMPTRLDSQGVMMCEIATFGMPLITSNIPICHEMLSGFSNVEYISNDSDQKVDLSILVNKLKEKKLSSLEPDKFNIEILAMKEIELARKLLSNRLEKDV